MPRTASLKDHEGQTHPDLTAPRTIGANRPDAEATMFAIAQLKKKQKEVEEVRLGLKRLRSALKLQGHTLDALDWGLSMEAQEDNTSEDQLRERIRVARFMNLPIGSQVFFFDEEGKPAADAAATDTVMAKAYEDGRRRGLAGDNPDEQAYPPMTAEGQEHMRGWHDGQAILARNLKPLEDAIAGVAKVEADKAAKKAAKAEKAVKAAENGATADAGDSEAEADTAPGAADAAAVH